MNEGLSIPAYSVGHGKGSHGDPVQIDAADMSDTSPVSTRVNCEGESLAAFGCVAARAGVAIEPCGKVG